MCISLIVCKGKSISNFSCEKFLITFDNVWKKFGIKKETRFYYTWDISTSFFFCWKRSVTRRVALRHFHRILVARFFFSAHRGKFEKKLFYNSKQRSAKLEMQFEMNLEGFEDGIFLKKWTLIFYYCLSSFFFPFFFFFLINCQAKF